MEKVKIKVWGYRCERCAHEWVPRGKHDPKVCPKCKSPYWDRPRKNKPQVEDTSLITFSYDFPFRILIYREDDDQGIVAHALDLDIIAIEDTEAKAIESLNKLIKAQIEFAVEKGNIDSLLFPAPDSYFKRWKKAKERLSA